MRGNEVYARVDLVAMIQLSGPRGFITLNSLAHFFQTWCSGNCSFVVCGADCVYRIVIFITNAAAISISGNVNAVWMT